MKAEFFVLLIVVGLAIAVIAHISYAPVYESDCVGTQVEEGNLNAWVFLDIAAAGLVFAGLFGVVWRAVK